MDDVMRRVERILEGKEDDRLFGKREEREVRKVNINGVEIEVPEGYKVEVSPEGKINVVPKDGMTTHGEEEDWEKIRKEFDRIDTVISVEDGRPIRVGGGEIRGTTTGNSPEIAGSVLREFGLTITPKELTEIQMERARRFGILMFSVLGMAIAFLPIGFLSTFINPVLEENSLLSVVVGWATLAWIPLGFYIAYKLYQREKRHYKELLFG